MSVIFLNLKWKSVIGLNVTFSVGVTDLYMEPYLFADIMNPNVQEISTGINTLHHSNRAMGLRERRARLQFINFMIMFY